MSFKTPRTPSSASQGKGSGVRVWKTQDGKHVAEGHPDAAFLAYTTKDRVPDEVLKEAYPEETKPRRAKTK